LFRVAQLKRDEKISGLIKICRDTDSDFFETCKDPDSNMHCKAAAEALASFGGREVAPLAKALSPIRHGSGWLTYALGRSPSPEALQALRRAANKIDARWEPHFNLAYAISLHGEEGKGLLGELARNPKMAHWAKERLKRTESGKTPKVDPPMMDEIRPRPKPGTLPKTFDKSRVGTGKQDAGFF